MLNVCNKLFECLNDDNVNYCSFKSNEHLMEGLVGKTDLDIVLDKTDYEKFVNICKQLEFKRFEPVDVGIYPNVENWYGMDNNTGVLIHIHLHFEIMTGKALLKDYCIRWGKYFLDTAMLDKKTNVKIANPSLEYILLCCRKIIKKSLYDVYLNGDVVNNEINVEMKYLESKLEWSELEKFVNELFTTKNQNRIIYYLKNIHSLNKKDYASFSRIIKKELKKYRRFPAIISVILSYGKRCHRYINRFFNKRLSWNLPLKKRCVNHGLRIALVGIDGSGKSTSLKNIYKWYGEEFDIVKFYAGSGDGKKNIISSFLLKGYSTVYNKNNHSSIDKTSSVKKKASLKLKVKHLFASIAFIKILKQNIANLKKSVKLKDKGLLCIMDRYPQNFLPGMHDGSKVTRYLEEDNSFITRYFYKKEQNLLKMIKNYKYDVVIRIVVDGSEAFNRKPEEKLESLEYKAKTIKTIKYDALETINIDGSNTKEEVLLNIKKIIWERL